MGLALALVFMVFGQSVASAAPTPGVATAAASELGVVAEQGSATAAAECVKVRASNPAPDKCGGVSQSPTATPRSRSDKRERFSLQSPPDAVANHRYASVAPLGLLNALVLPIKAFPSRVRRSAFWSMYAIAARYRG